MKNVDGMTVDEAAEVTGFSKSKLYALEKQGRISLATRSKTKGFDEGEFLKSYLSYDGKTGRFTWRQNLVHYYQSRAITSCKAGSTAGSQTKEGIVVYIKNKRYLAHHLAVFFVTGKWAKYVHHKDGNKLNNAYSNLLVKKFKEA